MNCSYCQCQKTDLLLLQLNNMIEDAPPQLRINRSRGLQAKDLLQIQSLALYKPRVIFQTQLLFSRNQLLFNKSLSSSTANTSFPQSKANSAYDPSFPQSKLNLRSHIGLNRKHWLKEVIWVGWNVCQPYYMVAENKSFRSKDINDIDGLF